MNATKRVVLRISLVLALILAFVTFHLLVILRSHWLC